MTVFSTPPKQHKAGKTKNKNVYPDVFRVLLFSFLLFVFFIVTLSLPLLPYSDELPSVNKNLSDQQTISNKKEEEDEEDEEEEESLPGSTLFVKNLNYSTTEETLQEVGSEFVKCGVKIRIENDCIIRSVFGSE